jgi:hypothetical protein
MGRSDIKERDQYQYILHRQQVRNSFTLLVDQAAHYNNLKDKEHGDMAHGQDLDQLQV